MLYSGWCMCCVCVMYTEKTKTNYIILLHIYIYNIYIYIYYVYHSLQWVWYSLPWNSSLWHLTMKCTWTEFEPFLGWSTFIYSLFSCKSTIYLHQLSFSLPSLTLSVIIFVTILYWNKQSYQHFYWKQFGLYRIQGYRSQQSTKVVWVYSSACHYYCVSSRQDFYAPPLACVLDYGYYVSTRKWAMWSDPPQEKDWLTDWMVDVETMKLFNLSFMT